MSMTMRKDRSAIHAQTTQSMHVSTACLVQVVPDSELEREALSMENLLQAFAFDEPFSLDLCSDLTKQRFLVRTSSEANMEALCQQILAQYPQARLVRISPMRDPLLLAGDEHALVGTFHLRAPTWMPIKTFWDKEMTQEGTDPLLGLLASMEPVSKDERIICQTALVRAPDSWGERYRRKGLESPLEREKQTASASESQSKSGDSLWSEASFLLLIAGVLLLGMQGYVWYRSQAWGLLALEVLALIAGCSAWMWWKLRQGETLYDAQLVGEKLLRSAFYTQVRVIVIGKRKSSEERLRKHLKRLEAAYRQYDLAGGNGFELKHTSHITSESEEAPALCDPEAYLPYHRTLARLIHRGWSDTVLNAREVSGMWHLLQGQAEAPLVQRLSSKRILASPELFQEVKQGSGTLPPTLIGHSRHKGYTVPVYIPEEILFSHKFLVAKSGYGKSTLMQLMLFGAMQPVRQPDNLQPGIVVVDPHGDLIDDLLCQVPESRIDDVLLVDLSDQEHPVGINLLDSTMGFSCDQAVANAMASFARIWRDSWGPRLAYVLRSVLRTLYLANEQLVAKGQKDRQYTLIDINPVLQQPKLARRILAELDVNNRHHQKMLSFWNDYYFKLPASMQQEVISPVSNKISIFSDNNLLEHIVGQSVTTVNLATAVQTGQIVLVNLASGRLEFDAAAIIGATFLNLVHRTLQLQAAIPLADRRQVFIAVDEFQNIPGADYEALLSEDRKYGGSLMLATQSLIRLEQMKEGLEAMTFSNCAQLFVFATSAEDAEKLEQELQEKVTIPHILNQPRLTCYARLAFPDRPSQIFSMQLAQPKSWQRSETNKAMAKALREKNRMYHPSVDDVDEQLMRRGKQFLEHAGQPAAQQNQSQQPKQQPGAQPNRPKQPNGQPNQPKQPNGQPGNQPNHPNQPRQPNGQPGNQYNQSNQPRQFNGQPSNQPNQPKQPNGQPGNQSNQFNQPKQFNGQSGNQPNQPKQPNGQPSQQQFTSQPKQAEQADTWQSNAQLEDQPGQPRQVDARSKQSNGQQEEQQSGTQPDQPRQTDDQPGEQQPEMRLDQPKQPDGPQEEQQPGARPNQPRQPNGQAGGQQNGPRPNQPRQPNGQAGGQQNGPRPNQPRQFNGQPGGQQNGPRPNQPNQTRQPNGQPGGQQNGPRPNQPKSFNNQPPNQPHQHNAQPKQHDLQDGSSQQHTQSAPDKQSSRQPEESQEERSTPSTTTKREVEGASIQGSHTDDVGE